MNAKHLLFSASLIFSTALGCGHSAGVSSPTASDQTNSLGSKPCEPKTKLLFRSGNSNAFAAGVSLKTESHLSAGTRLTAVVRDSCVTPGEISSSIAVNSARKIHPTKSASNSYSFVLPRDFTQSQLAKTAEADSCLESLSEAVVDRPVSDSSKFSPPQTTLPNDPEFPLEKHLFAIGAEPAYRIFYQADQGIKRDVVIAIIDTGVRIDHEDLKANIWVNEGEIPANGIDDDRNGYIDDVNGYNFASDIPSPMPEQTQANAAWQWAHGTKVAGLAAATAFNGLGGAGIAANAKIMALNNMGRSDVMDQANTANAVRYAIDNGADVINLSLGGNDGLSADLENQLRRAVMRGIVVFAAAGNEHKTIGSNYSAAGLSPQLPGLVSVGNFQSSNYQISTTSNFSTTYVKLGAPGTNSMSGLLYTTSPESNSSYSYFSGTSAATPVASGAAALAIGLIRSRGFTFTAAEIENLMLTSARKTASLKGYFRDGNALDLEALAQLIDHRYPERQIASVQKAPTSQLPNPAKQDCSPR